jgi:hypothetical protein
MMTFVHIDAELSAQISKAAFDTARVTGEPYEVVRARIVELVLAHKDEARANVKTILTKGARGGQR